MSFVDHIDHQIGQRSHRYGGVLEGRLAFRELEHGRAMHPQVDLSLGQQFEIERFNRAIDATADPEQLRQLAKQLLQAWHTQKAATQWVMAQQESSAV